MGKSGKIELQCGRAERKFSLKPGVLIGKEDGKSGVFLPSVVYAVFFLIRTFWKQGKTGYGALSGGDRKEPKRVIVLPA